HYTGPSLPLAIIHNSVLYGILFARPSPNTLSLPVHVLTFTSQYFPWRPVFLDVRLGMLLGYVISTLSTRYCPALVVHWRGFPPPEQRLFDGSAVFGRGRAGDRVDGAI
ncbi:hypothetical protein BDZ89DRAFT_1177414, partial [Hymenopellis radicata]